MTAPAISVLLPIAQTSAPVLADLAAQQLDHSRFEVVVVPDSEATRAALEPQLTGLEHQLLAPVDDAVDARNVALDAARGENLLLLVDGDRLSPNALGELLAAADGHRLPTLPTADEVELLAGRRADELGLYKLPGIAVRARGKLYPRWMVADHRFEHVGRPEAVFSARVHERFATQYVQVDGRPAAAGALITLAPQPAPAVGDLMKALQGVLAGSQARPEERSPVTDVVAQEIVQAVEADLREHPEHRDLVREQAAQVRGVQISTAGGGRWPGYGVAVGTEQPQHPLEELSVISETTRQLAKRGDRIGLVRGGGINVRAAYLAGAYDAKKMPFPHHRITIVPEGTERTFKGQSLGAKVARRAHRAEKVARLAARRVAPRLVPAQALPRVVRMTDPAAGEFLGGSAVVGLSPSARALASGLGVEACDAALLDALTLSAASVRGPILNKHANSIRLAARSVAKQPAEWEYMPPVPVWAMTVWRLYKNARLAGAVEVLESARTAHPEPEAKAVFDALGLLVHVGQKFSLPEGWQQVAAAAMAQADEALALGDLAEAVFLTDLVCEALIHPDLNANAENPPIVRDPEGLLAPLRASRTWQLLTQPQTEQGSTAPRELEPRPSMLLIPGAYPKFAKGVVAALREAGEVEVVNLQDYGTPFGNTGVRPQEILVRLRHALGMPPGETGELAGFFQGRDAVFADWADKGAMIASLFTPADTRLVVRMHGVDGLSLWPHLVDWTRVDDVIFVSEHLCRVVNSILGSRLDGVNQHVIGNFVDVDKFAAESSEDARFTLGMVGWAQKVKDPLYAVEILAKLRSHDPRYRLKLVGADFPIRQARAAEDEYAQAFRKRVLADDVVDGIDFVGYSTDLPRHLRGIGFAMSTSLRESWPVGPTEMVAAQAVPLYRDWPVFRDVGGPRLIFGDWVFDTQEEAVERILALREPDDWLAAANAARQRVRDEFGPRETGSLYRAIVTGSDRT